MQVLGTAAFKARPLCIVTSPGKGKAALKEKRPDKPKQACRRTTIRNRNYCRDSSHIAPIVAVW